MKHLNYVLDSKGEPRAEPDFLKWAQGMDRIRKSKKNIVKQEYINDIWISTVFLGINHRFSSNGPPILWETMTFTKSGKGNMHNLMKRCSGSREQADAMHISMCEYVRANSRKRAKAKTKRSHKGK